MVTPIKREGNIEFRQYNKTTYEIVRWIPNKYFGKEEDYIKDGEWYTPKENPKKRRIHSEVFKHEFVCYKLATIDSANPYIKGVEFRLFEIPDEEFKDLKSIIEYAKTYVYSLPEDKL